MGNVTAKFATPIPYGAGELAELTMRRPKAGDLKGVKLIGLTEMDPSMVIKIAARLATTPVVEAQLEQLEVYDLMELTEKVVGFFGKPEMPAGSQTTSTEHGPT